MTEPDRTLIEHLINTYQPLAILAHGSRVRGDAASASDYDIMLITAHAGDARPFVFNGCMVDVDAARPDLAYLAHGDVPVWPVAVWYDNDEGHGRAVAERTKKVFDAGPAPLDVAAWGNRRNFFQRQHARLQARGNDPALHAHYAGILVGKALQYYAEKAGMWTQSTHALATAIAARDPAFYADVQRMPADDVAVVRVYHTLFGEGA